MHFVTFEAASGMFAYGPFDDELAATAWFFPWAAHLDPDQVRATNIALSEPFDLRSPEVAAEFDDLTPVPPTERVPAVHTGQAADPRAQGYAVRVTDDDSHQGGIVGPFDDREQAERWWDAQAEFIRGAHAHILPLLAPQPPRTAPADS